MWLGNCNFIWSERHFLVPGTVSLHRAAPVVHTNMRQRYKIQRVAVISRFSKRFHILTWALTKSTAISQHWVGHECTPWLQCLVDSAFCPPWDGKMSNQYGRLKGQVFSLAWAGSYVAPTLTIHSSDLRKFSQWLDRWWYYTHCPRIIIIIIISIIIILWFGRDNKAGVMPLTHSMFLIL